MGYSVIGTTESAIEYSKAEFIVAIGNPKSREKVQKQLGDAGLQITTLIHPKAVIADNVEISEGTVIMAGAVVNPDSKIGVGAVVSNNLKICEDCMIGDGAVVVKDIEKSGMYVGAPVK